MLPQLAAESFSLLLTSPPWNIGLAYNTYADAMGSAEFNEFCRDWLKAAFPLMADSSRFYAVVSDAMMWWFRPMAEEIGWQYCQLLAWLKPNFCGGTSRMSGDWNQMAEWIPLFRKGKRTPMQSGVWGGTTHNWFVIPTPQSNWNEDAREHPAQWPVELPSRIISRTVGDGVLDPFSGSGSGLVAAKRWGKKAVGIETDEKYCEISAKRLSQEVFDFREAQ
jgi:site-specific DNA-methyltransferase (adenine-specific)